MVWKKSNQNSAATYDIKIWKKIFQGRFRKLEVRKDKPKSPMSIGFVLKKFLSIIKKKFENLENIRNFCGQKWTKKGKKKCACTGESISQSLYIKRRHSKPILLYRIIQSTNLFHPWQTHQDKWFYSTGWKKRLTFLFLILLEKMSWTTYW